MITLIALMLMTGSSEGKPPKYKADSCHSSDSEFRPSTIKIVQVGYTNYQYQVWNGPTLKWAGQYFINSFEAIETVYEKDGKCPDAK